MTVQELIDMLQKVPYKDQKVKFRDRTCYERGIMGGYSRVATKEELEHIRLFDDLEWIWKKDGTLEIKEKEKTYYDKTLAKIYVLF